MAWARADARLCERLCVQRGPVPCRLRSAVIWSVRSHLRWCLLYYMSLCTNVRTCRSPSRDYKNKTQVAHPSDSESHIKPYCTQCTSKTISMIIASWASSEARALSSQTSHARRGSRSAKAKPAGSRSRLGPSHVGLHLSNARRPCLAHGLALHVHAHVHDMYMCMYMLYTCTCTCTWTWCAHVHVHRRAHGAWTITMNVPYKTDHAHAMRRAIIQYI